MKIAIAASECAPFAKTGGLSDVIGSLPKALRKEGCEVKVFLPKYSVIDESRQPFHFESVCGEMPIRVGGVTRSVRVMSSTLPNSDVPIYFIDCPHYFHRARIYTADWDEDERFILFTKAVIETLQRMNWAPDIIHCNDWQTGLLPLLLRDNYGWDRLFDRTATMFSIHNIAYQGYFGRQSGIKAELRADHLDNGGLAEWGGGCNFMKTGISTADIITTVSHTYAREILTPEYGAGMETVLRWRQGILHGVLNGIDDDIWNPETDKHLPHKFSQRDLSGKEKCKKFLLDQTTIDYNPNVPLIGIISRLVGQKGFNLVADEAEWLMKKNAQWVILGSGEDRFEELFQSLAHIFPHKVWNYTGFNTELSHLIEAAADMFLMPSHYEPCGLNQMYSLRYGTVPIVRKTGGLADTVYDWHELSSHGNPNGNGFSFNDATGFALSATVNRAIEAFHDKDTWRKIQQNGMAMDLSWRTSAKRYIDLYRLAQRR
jgi:starch synthase